MAGDASSGSSSSGGSHAPVGLLGSVTHSCRAPAARASSQPSRGKAVPTGTGRGDPRYAHQQQVEEKPNGHGDDVARFESRQGHVVQEGAAAGAQQEAARRRAEAQAQAFMSRLPLGVDVEGQGGEAFEQRVSWLPQVAGGLVRCGGARGAAPAPPPRGACRVEGCRDPGGGGSWFPPRAQGRAGAVVGQSFGLRQARDPGCHGRGVRAGEAEQALPLLESCDKGAGIARRAAGGQHVVGARAVVAEGLRAAGTDEGRSAAAWRPGVQASGSRTMSSRCSGAQAWAKARASSRSARTRPVAGQAGLQDGARRGEAATRVRSSASTLASRPPSPGTSTAASSGSCSAWARRSSASQAGSAVSSARMSSSVGPATLSMPQRPISCRLASATKRLPGPAMRSTAGSP